MAPPAKLLERLQLAAGLAAVGFGLLGFFASVGLRLLPMAARELLWVLHPLLLVVGTAAGLAAVWRGEEIDRRRWEIVEDPLLTSGEREYAHKEAERQRRVAGTAFLALPLALGYWLAHQVEVLGGVAPVHLQPVSGILGFVLGLLAAHLGKRRRR